MAVELLRTSGRRGGRFHFDQILTFYGKVVGLRMFRKHLASYLKNATASLFNCKALMTESSINRLKSGIHFAFDKQALEVRW